MMTKQIPAASLVLDFNLYPRHRVDEANVRTLVDALTAGAKLPAVVADAESLRVVDGFHRVTALLKRDESAQVEVELRSYADEAEMFADAIALNAHHGLKLSGYDRVRCLELGSRIGLTDERLAVCFATTTDAVLKMRESRTAIASDGSPMAIKRTLRHLAGHQLSEKQERANRRAQGWPVWFHCEQVSNALTGDIVNWNDERTVNALRELESALHKILAAHAA